MKKIILIIALLTAITVPAAQEKIVSVNYNQSVYFELLDETPKLIVGNNIYFVQKYRVFGNNKQIQKLHTAMTESGDENEFYRLAPITVISKNKSFFDVKVYNLVGNIN